MAGSATTRKRKAERRKAAKEKEEKEKRLAQEREEDAKQNRESETPEASKSARKDKSSTPTVNCKTEDQTTPTQSNKDNTTYNDPNNRFNSFQKETVKNKLFPGSRNEIIRKNKVYFLVKLRVFLFISQNYLVVKTA